MIKEVNQFCWSGRPQLGLIEVSTSDGNHYFIFRGKVVASLGVDGVKVLDEWDADRQTAKWVARFLNCKSAKEVREHIESGRYRLVFDLVIP